ncbi:uncharacterized protein RSE6_07143 [Rhynchosporium secalis]|uniref:Uncharacterized protein n=1 Tax=Rhynchosporium secalis TaxID=38038 RepID=A0A1E1MCA4_RHYSE|nr:uncharacterized protein RSE6_07143 [Rhynchosporium secalis]
MASKDRHATTSRHSLLCYARLLSYPKFLPKMRSNRSETSSREKSPNLKNYPKIII